MLWDARAMCIPILKTLPYPGFPTDMQPQIRRDTGIGRGNQCSDRVFLKTVLNMWTNLPAWVDASR